MTPDALDITVGVVLFLSMLTAYFRGLIREVFTIIAMVAATGASYFGGPLMIPPFEKWLDVDKDAAKIADQQAADAVSKAAAGGTDAIIVKGKLIGGILAHEHAAQICGYASVFLFIYFVMSLVGFFLTRAVAESGLSLVDRLLGAGFGLARGCLLVFLIYLPVWYFYQGKEEPMPVWAKNSVSVPVLDKAVAYVDEHVNLTNVIHDAGDVLARKIKKRAGQAAEKTGAAPVHDEAHSPDANAVAPSEDDQKELQDELKEEDKKAAPP